RFDRSSSTAYILRDHMVQLLPQVLALLSVKLGVLPSKQTKAISLISDRHSDLRDTSRFEPPSSKRLSGHFIEDRVTGALCHHRVGNFAAAGVDNHRTNTASINIRAFCLVWIFWQWRSDREGFRV